MGQKVSDMQVERAVRKSLSSDPTFKYTDVKADVYEGNVQLSGFVETSEQCLRAAEHASRAKGAKQVINEIMIKPTPTGSVTVRDPLGRDTGYLLVNTNNPPPKLRNLPSPETPATTESAEPVDIIGEMSPKSRLH